MGRLTILPEEWEDLDRELTAPVALSRSTRPTGSEQEGSAGSQPSWCSIGIAAGRDAAGALVAGAGLMPYAVALAEIHFPRPGHAGGGSAPPGLRRAALLQLGSQRQRGRAGAHRPPLKMATSGSGRSSPACPKLTGAQQRVSEPISRDMARPEPMNRLLQGDVGSGKTAVAPGRPPPSRPGPGRRDGPHRKSWPSSTTNPAKLLAPALAIPAPWACSRFHPRRRKRSHLRRSAVRRHQAVVGTHALIEGPVEFANLGLVIVDEQHRFGVASAPRLARQGRPARTCW